MTKEQMFSIICFYRKAVHNELDENSINKEILKARKDLDLSYTLKGEEDPSIANYLNELLFIQSSLS